MNLSPTLTAAASVTGKTVVTTQDGAQEAIEADAFKAGVDVNENGEINSESPITVEITEGANGRYIFNVKYTGEKPELEAIRKAINKALTEAGIDEEAAYIAKDGIVVADASDKTLGTIGTVGTFKLYINGEEIEGVTLSNVADDVEKAKVPAGATDCLIVEGTGNIDPEAVDGSVYKPVTAMGETIVTIPVDVMKSLDKDLKLVNAYALSLTDNEVSAKYSVGETKNGTAEKTKLFHDGTKFVFTGFNTVANGTGLKLTLGDETWITAAEKTGTHVWDEITFDAATMLDAETKTIKPVEDATNDLKVVIGSNEYTVQFASDDSYFIVNMTRVMPEAGSYIALNEDGKWDNSASNVWTAAADGNNMKFTAPSAQGSSQNIVDGVLTLRQAVKVTVPANLQYAFDGNTTTTTSQETSFYVSLGSEIQIATKDEKTTHSSGPDTTDRLIVEYTEGQDTKVLATVTGDYPTWTIPADLLDGWTESQITAGLSVRMYTARGLIEDVETEVDKQQGNDAKSGDIEYKDNVITATGNLNYVGLPFEGESDAKTIFRHTVANDLRVFLRELHSLGEDAAENPYETITYKGTEYTWGTQTEAQAGENDPATGYLNKDGKTLISIVVDESARIYGKLDVTLVKEDPNMGLHVAPGGADMSVTLKVDGFDIIFKTVIDKTSEFPEGVGAAG